MLIVFFIIEPVEIFYRLQLSEFIRIHDIFNLYLLQKDLDNFLLK